MKRKIPGGSRSGKLTVSLDYCAISGNQLLVKTNREKEIIIKHHPLCDKRIISWEEIQENTDLMRRNEIRNG